MRQSEGDSSTPNKHAAREEATKVGITRNGTLNLPKAKVKGLRRVFVTHDAHDASLVVDVCGKKGTIRGGHTCSKEEKPC